MAFVDNKKYIEHPQPCKQKSTWPVLFAVLTLQSVLSNIAHHQWQGHNCGSQGGDLKIAYRLLPLWIKALDVNAASFWCVNMSICISLFSPDHDKTTSRWLGLKAPLNGPCDRPFTCACVHFLNLNITCEAPRGWVKLNIITWKREGVYRSPLQPQCACKAMVVFDWLL